MSDYIITFLHILVIKVLDFYTYILYNYMMSAKDGLIF
jgi:hypothetical protein